MAGNFKKEIKMENVEIKGKIQEEILPSSTVENTCTVEDLCTVYIKEEDIKMETQGKQYLKIRNTPLILVRVQVVAKYLPEFHI